MHYYYQSGGGAAAGEASSAPVASPPYPPHLPRDSIYHADDYDYDPAPVVFGGGVDGDVAAFAYTDTSDEESPVYDDDVLSLPMVDPWHIAIWSCCGVGVALNVITISVFLQQGRVTGGPGNRVRLNPALLQLVVLSVSDLLMLIGLIVMNQDLGGTTHRHIYETLLELNAWCTVMIAVTRCFAVTRPFQYFLSTHRTDATKNILFSLLTPILLTLITELLKHLAEGAGVFEIKDCDDVCLVALRWSFALFRFFLPFFLIFLSAIIISVRLWHQPVRLMRHQSLMTHHHHHNYVPAEATEMTQLATRGGGGGGAAASVTRMSTRGTAVTSMARDAMMRASTRASTRRANSLNPAVTESIGLVQRITRMSLGVVVMYFLTHIIDFFQVLKLLDLLGVWQNIEETLNKPTVISVNYLLLAMNSSTNLFIYLWLSADFKQTFLHVFFCRSLERLVQCGGGGSTRRRGGPCRRRSTGSTSLSAHSNHQPPLQQQQPHHYHHPEEEEEEDDVGVDDYVGTPPNHNNNNHNNNNNNNNHNHNNTGRGFFAGIAAGFRFPSAAWRRKSEIGQKSGGNDKSSENNENNSSNNHNQSNISNNHVSNGNDSNNKSSSSEQQQQQKNNKSNNYHHQNGGSCSSGSGGSGGGCLRKQKSKDEDFDLLPPGETDTTDIA